MPDLIIVTILASLIIWCIGQAKASRERREHIEAMKEHRKMLTEELPRLAAAADVFKEGSDQLAAEVRKFGEMRYREGVRDGKELEFAMQRLASLGQEIEAGRKEGKTQ